MPLWTDDQGDDGFDDSGEEEELESFGDDDEPTIACPYCRTQIHEDSQRCPYCERYISKENAPAARRPWWIVIGAALGLYAVYRWILR